MDEDAKKQLLRSVPYGLYLAATQREDGGHHVFLLSWLTQTSFDPPLIVCGIHQDSKAFKHLTRQARAPIAISLLAADQKPLAQLALKKQPFEESELAEHPHEAGKNGCLLLPETLGTLEAEVVDVLDHGDHGVFLCEITEAHRFNEGDPLTHGNTGWHYGG